MWRLATMTPLGISISPHGPDKIQPGVPSISPDWRITPMWSIYRQLKENRQILS